MQSNYKTLGKYIRKVENRDINKQVSLLLGVSIQKKFIPSIANIIGTDMSTYRIVKKNQFAYGPVTSRNGDKISIALLEDYEEAIVSQAYTVFEVSDTNELLPEYLMMWFRRPEFDRYARFMSHGSAREVFDWEEMLNTTLPVPPIDKQKEIVKEYNTIINRITLNNQLIQKLEETAQAIYRQWFVDFEFPDAEGKPYKSNGGEMDESEMGEIPKGWNVGKMGDLISIVNGYAFSSSDFKEGGKFPILKIANIQPPKIILEGAQFYDGEISKSLCNCIVNGGDILISMTGSHMNQMNSAVGKIGRYNYRHQALLNQRVSRLQPHKNIICKEYVYYFMSKEETQLELLMGATGSANQANISPPQIKGLKTLIPDESLLKKFDDLADAINNKIILAEQTAKCLNDLKDLLLSKLATIENLVLEEEFSNIEA